MGPPIVSPPLSPSHPPTPPPCRSPALITLRTPTQFQLVLRRLCDYVCAVPLALPLRAHPLCYPRIGLVVNIIFIRQFCDHVNVLHIFDQKTCIVSKSGWSCTMGPPRRCSPHLSPCHPPTSPLYSICGHSGYLQSDVRSLKTTIVEGLIERHKSRLESRETCGGLTGTYSRGSLDRTESVPKWSRERRARPGLREASRRDKAVRSCSIHHSLCPECG